MGNIKTPVQRAGSTAGTGKSTTSPTLGTGWRRLPIRPWEGGLQWILEEKHYSISPYVYCLDNPLRYIDPDGKDPDDLFKSPTKAAKDWGRYYNGASILRGKEFLSSIYIVKKQGKIFTPIQRLQKEVQEEQRLGLLRKDLK